MAGKFPCLPFVEKSIQFLKKKLCPPRQNRDNRFQFGASPRASINLNLSCKALAYMDGRDYVLPEDIKEVALDVMDHRILLNYRAEAEGIKVDAQKKG